jgi:type VI secretion system protein ImpE
MTTPQRIAERLSADELTEAVAEAQAALRAKPGEARLRHLLIDLLILSGDLLRADAQAATAATLNPADAVGLGMLRGEIRGMHARAEWYRSGALPSFPNGLSEADAAALRLGVALRENDGEGARAAADVLEHLTEGVSVSWNGAAQQAFRDLDDRLPHAFEAITTGGAYLWIGFSTVASLRLKPVARPRDLAFPRAELVLRDGSASQVLLPALYDPGEAILDDALRLGRRTDWRELPGGLVAGLGQRCFLVGDAVEPLLEARSIGSANVAEAVHG